MTFELIESSGAPIKAWTRGVQVEDQARQQLRNLASMPFIFRHVAAMPDVHWGMGATVGSVIATKGAIIPAAVGVDIGCFRGDTRIPLLDGTQATLRDLTSLRGPFWVYSINKELQIVPGHAVARETRRNARLMRVVVSGGEEIFCTPDHPFMLLDGSFRAARDLRFNDSLMPLHRTWQSRDGYEPVSNGKGRVAHALRGAPHLRRFNTSPRACTECDHVASNPAALRWHREGQHGHNHKVTFVGPVEERADVFCLQVEEHHNFALAAGVFVHNCGMGAQRTTLRASDLPDGLARLRTAIERRIPHGRTNHGGPGDRGAWGRPPPENADLLSKHLAGLDAITAKHPKLERAAARAPLHAGTLGTGNHFIEVCLDEDQRVWLMLHSGSRGIGNAIGQYFIEAAKTDMRRWIANLPDQDLAYLSEGSKLFDDYFQAVGWAQVYARLNRAIMMREALAALQEVVPKPIACDEAAVNCHHNYVQVERHFGEDVMVTRKGAVDAHAGVLGIIPGSMGAKSFIVRGKGNPESFSSCSHGAGRKMSRGEAKRTFTLADHDAATAGVECRKDADVIDETPGAYKDIDAVMAAQSDLVEVVHTLKQVVCVKG